MRSLRSRKGRRGVHFSGFARKMNPIPPSRASEASARTSSLDFMYGFKIFLNKIPDKLTFTLIAILIINYKIIDEYDY
ncbi:MAG: hypothetical protein U5L45_04610 [Saprospiraceae bacterium]|nr:hypothetical protein [Saprospiraceae bacterium]